MNRTRLQKGGISSTSVNLLQGKSLSKISDQPVKCSVDFSILDCAKLMSAKRAHCIVIVGKKSPKMVGFVTAKDMAFRVVACNLDTQSPITQVMTVDPYFVSSSASANDALRLMVNKKIRHLPLVDGDGIVVGLLNINKCFYHAMIRLGKMSEGARRLQCTFENLNEDNPGIENKGSMYMLPEDSVAVNEQIFDLNIRQRKMCIANDLKRLIDILKQPELESLLVDKNSDVSHCATLGPSTTILDAAVLLRKKNVTAALICKVKKVKEGIKASDVIGIITTKDILFRVLADGYDPAVMKVARFMTPRPNFAQETMGIQNALRLMYEGKYLNLPIVNQHGIVTGLVDVLHLTNALLKTLDLATVESSTFPSRKNSDVFQSQSNSSSNEESIGPAWNKFWESLDEPLRSVSSTDHLSRRSSSYNHSKFNLSVGNKSFQSIPSISYTSAEIGTQSVHITPSINNNGKTLNFKLKVFESLNLDLDGKLYKVKVTTENINSEDSDLLTIIKEKVSRKLDLHTYPNLLLDFSYIDADGDHIALDKKEDLDVAFESNLKQLVIVLNIKEKTISRCSSATSHSIPDDTQFPVNIVVNPGFTALAVSSVVAAAILLSNLWVVNVHR